MIERIVLKLLFTLGIILLTGCTTMVSTSNYLDYQTKATLMIPLKGESFIAYGGRTLEQNHHASSRDQRFALDIVALK